MIEMTWVLPYLVLGLAVGFFAGLLGIGGGGIMVPILTMLFISQSLNDSHLVHLALGTSMASIVMTSCSSLLSHQRRGSVRWDVFQQMLPGILLGTFLFSILAAQLSSSFLAIFFSVFMTYIALQMFLDFKPKPTRKLPRPMLLSGVAFVFGGFSALVAVGGGTMNVPFLTWCNVYMPHAIGTAAALGLPIAIAGSLGYIISGWSVVDLPAYSTGYVYWPAVLLISSMSIFTAPLGARLAHVLPTPLLKKVFAGMLLLLAINMLRLV